GGSARSQSKAGAPSWRLRRKEWSAAAVMGGATGGDGAGGERRREENPRLIAAHAVCRTSSPAPSPARGCGGEGLRKFLAASRNRYSRPARGGDHLHSPSPPRLRGGEGRGEEGPRWIEARDLGRASSPGGDGLRTPLEPP